MVTVCYLINNCAESALAVKKIEDSIPCWIMFDMIDNFTIEVTISCRTEDITFIHEVLAPYV